MANRIAVVTGGSKGIGQAITAELARSNYRVIATYRQDRETAEKSVEAINRSVGSDIVQTFQMDVRDPDSVTALFDGVKTLYGHLEMLVNNAATELSTYIDEQTLSDWKTVLDTKLVGAFLCTKAALELFQESDTPSMVAISSFEAEQASPEFTAYAVANAGLDAFIKSMAQFLPKYGARANAVCPGPVNTPLWGPDQENEELWKELAEANPTGRNATPEDIAQTVRMIAEEPTRMVNGNFVYVNGGNHLRQP